MATSSPPLISVQTRLYDSDGNIVDTNMSSLFFGTLGFMQEGETVIFDMKVFEGASAISSLKLGIVDADIGGFDVEDVYFIGSHSSFGDIVDPTTAFPGLNELEDPSSSNNFSIGTRASRAGNVIQSNFVVMKAKAPERPIGTSGRCYFRWFFDFVVGDVSAAELEASLNSSSSSSSSSSSPSSPSSINSSSSSLNSSSSSLSTLSSSSS